MPYVRPGVYIQEKYVAGGVAAGGFVIPCIVGKGLTKRRYWDEEVVRGKISGELITHDGLGVVTLAHSSNQKKSTSILTKNSQELPIDAYAFTAANSITIALAYRDATATWTFTYLAVDVDTDTLANTPTEVIYVSKSPGGARSYAVGTDYQITTGKIDWSVPTVATKLGANSGPFDLTTNRLIKISIDGKAAQEIDVQGAVPAATTTDEIVDSINAALLSAYGSSYGAVASDVTGLSTSIALANAIRTSVDAHAADQGVTGEEHKAADVGYPTTAPAATNLATLLTLTTELLSDYAAHNEDAINAAPTYHQAQSLPGNALVDATAAVDLPDAVAKLNDLKAKLNLHYADSIAHTDGDTALIVMVDAVIGKVTLTSVQTGVSGMINFFAPSATDATNTIFGVTPPAYYIGTGKEPTIGETYYVRYDATRLAADYDSVKLFYQYGDAMNVLGPMTTDNELLIACEMAFGNGAQIVAVIQVFDIDIDGVYMYNDWTRALDAVKDSTIVSELVLLNGDDNVIGYAVDVVSDEASLLVNHWMAGYFGADVGTTIGDPDTAGTLCYKSTQVAQVWGSNPARGRFLFMGVDSFKYQIVVTDTNKTAELILDGYMIGACVAGFQAGMPLISDSLLRKQITGPVPSSIDVTESEASFMANYGIFTLINKGGKVICFDPVTTDQGGDELFIEPNIRLQKDYLAKNIRDRLDSYVIGVVPDDLSDFVNEVKTQIALEIEGAIDSKIVAPFRDSEGKTRDIDLDIDINVYQSQTTKTEYRFKYWFQAKWTVKRMWGEYLVDSALTSG